MGTESLRFIFSGILALSVVTGLGCKSGGGGGAVPAPGVKPPPERKIPEGQTNLQKEFILLVNEIRTDTASPGDLWDGRNFTKPAPVVHVPTRLDELWDKIVDDTATLPEIRELLRLGKGP